jgi:signal transduction histidine kinase
MNNACYAVWHKSEELKMKNEEYSPEISISVQCSNLKPQTSNLKPQTSMLVISIADNGEGMTEEVKQRLFENFFTTKPIGQGTGLGMNITRDIIENKHHGKITFTSTLGEGTTFTFTIPVRPSA